MDGARPEGRGRPRGTERWTGQGPKGEDGPDCPAVEKTVCVGRTAPGRRICGCRGGGDKWSFKGNSRVRVVSKLDVSRFRWIVREKARGGMTNGEIAEAMRASRRMV